MKEWRKYASARDQLYHYTVKLREMHGSIPASHRSVELVQLMEMVELISEQCKVSFEQGTILAMQLDHYSMVPLPGFEDYDAEMKKPPSWKET